MLVGGAVSPLWGVQEKEKMEEEVSPVEDLMREHGLLKRVMLCYEEILRRLEKKAKIPSGVLSESAAIIRNFIENYHERLEEDYLFPRFNKANMLTELVDVLLKQHKAGRVLSGVIIDNSNEKALREPAKKSKVMDALRQFNRMYGPHAAREDTVLFPALRLVVTSKEYDALGEEFEKKEHELFGKEGFEGMVEKVSANEKKLGINDLAQFTPKV